MKKMKNVILIVLAALTISSCATVFGGKITVHQKTKPAAGEQRRNIRVVALVANIILFPLGTIVDFATGAIYKPTKTIVTK